MLKEIKAPQNYIIYENDGVDAVSIYRGGFYELHGPEKGLHWRKDEEAGEYGIHPNILSLKEIADQIGGGMITVFISGPLHGEILQYGNYGDSWWKIGETAGYA